MSVSRFCVLFILMIWLPSFARAGNSLKGHVTDSHGVSLEGVIVEITDLKTGAATDSDGNYVIANLPKGSYVVEVHLLSFATITRTVIIDGDTHTDFVLNENVIEKNEVVVTGSSLATEERKSITPIQSISIKEMRENAFTNVIDAISALPGVSAVTTGPAVSKPMIRGLGFNRIITLNDGVRQEGQQWGDEHGIEIDDYNVSRIEVLKGPASLAYGSDALAGVINIISNPNIPNGKVIGNITSNYQTNAGVIAMHADIGGNHNGFSWNFYTTQKDAHDYHNKYDGYVFDSRYHNTNFGASIGVNKSWGSSRLAFTSFNMKIGIPDGDRDSATGRLLKEVYENGLVSSVIPSSADSKSYEMTTPYQQIKHQKIVWDNNIYLGNGGRIGFSIGYQQNTRKEFDIVEQPDVAGLHLLLQTATYDVKYYLPPLWGWQFTIGANGMSQWNSNRGSEFLVPDYQLFDGGIFVMGKKDWKKWNFAGGLRYDFRILDVFQKTEMLTIDSTSVLYIVAAPFKGYYANVSGSAGAGYSLSEKSMLKLNFSSGYRSPNIAELSANGVHDGTIRYEMGSMTLLPENSLQTDIGFSRSSEHLMINFTLFDNYIKNFIYIYKLGYVPMANNPDKFYAYRYTQGDANLYGGELYLDYHPHPLDWLHLENTFSYVRGKLAHAVDGTYNLPYMPPGRWLCELRAQARSVNKFIKNAYAKVGLDMNAAQDNVFSAYETETKAKGYTLLDAGIGADFTNNKHRTIFTLTIAGQNLTDEAYQNALSRLRYTPANVVTGRPGIYNIGRNFSLMVSIPLDLK